MSSWQNIKAVNLKIIVRYALFQVPELILIIIGLNILRIWIDLTDWLWAIVLLMILKDIILFPLTWRAYDWDNPQNTNPLLGRQGITRERLAPKGYIFINGELWLAETADGKPVIEKEQPVIVTHVKGLTLVVRPAGRNVEDE